MCILFIIIGSYDFPTVIGNNRDEYFDRQTMRGQFHPSSNAYYPLDCVGGGSWLRFENLSSGLCRFAIVLNLDVGMETISRHSDNELLSRGLLVKNYFDQSELSARQYIDIVFATTMNYRPFNLIVGDCEGNRTASTFFQ